MERSRARKGRDAPPSRRAKSPVLGGARPTPVVGAQPHVELLRLQGHAGNRAVTRSLDVQRDGPSPAPALKVVPPGTAFIRSGVRFDLRYDPVGPVPATGKATVTLKVNVTFKDFERSMMRRPEFRRHRWTAAQRAAFAWPADKKGAWVGKFSTAVADGWKEKHTFVLAEPDYQPHKATCDVKVQHVDKPEEANTRITAQWVPPGAPRLRSSVSGATAELDARDVDELEKHSVHNAQLVRRIGPFDYDSAELTPTVVSSIDALKAAVRRELAPGRMFAGPSEDVMAEFVGRASSKGPDWYNKKLAKARVDAVEGNVTSDLSLGITISSAVGERNATEDESFQRVDVRAMKGESVDAFQNVAAHEAGHMFGLGDEYVEEEPPKDVLAKFEGDRASHDADVRAELGDEAADELLVQGGSSMMSSGSDVKPGHYVYFLQALEAATSLKWRIE